MTGRARSLTSPLIEAHIASIDTASNIYSIELKLTKF